MPTFSEREAKLKRESETRAFDGIRRLYDRLGGGLTFFQLTVVILGGAFLFGFAQRGPITTIQGWLFIAGIIAVWLLGLLLIARRSTWARPFWVVSLFVMMVPTVRTLAQMPDTTDRRDMSRVVLALGFWLVYWIRSKRVKREFARKKK